jgi:hypothetical protein
MFLRTAVTFVFALAVLIRNVEAKKKDPVIQNNWERVEKNIALPGIWGRLISEGLTHDDTHWFLNSKKVLYKASKTMEKEIENKHAIPEELSKEGYGHIGDIDYYDGIIYGGIEISKSAPGVIASWNSTDLSLIKYQVQEQNGMPWVACDGNTRLLYSTHWSDTSRINVYDMDTFEHKVDLTVFPVSDADEDQFPEEIQGAAFWDQDPGFIYLAVNGKESIYRVNVSTGAVTFVLSDKQYKSHEAEMEGLTFWDLSEDGNGQMHMFGNFEEVVQKGLHSYAWIGDGDTNY